MAINSFFRLAILPASGHEVSRENGGILECVNRRSDGNVKRYGCLCDGSANNNTT